MLSSVSTGNEHYKLYFKGSMCSCSRLVRSASLTAALKKANLYPKIGEFLLCPSIETGANNQFVQ